MPIMSLWDAHQELFYAPQIFVRELPDGERKALMEALRSSKIIQLQLFPNLLAPHREWAWPSCLRLSCGLMGISTRGGVVAELYFLRRMRGM